MNSRIVIFVVAFLCIAVGVMGILPYINNTNQAPAKPKVQKKPEIKYTLWFTRESLQEGEAVQRQELYAKTISKKEAEAYGFTSNVKIDIKKGMVANQDIEEGMPITQALFSAPGDSDYISLIVTPNMIPYSFSVDSSDNIGSIISFNDYVDILALTASDINLSSSNIKNNYSSLELTTVLTGVRVLGVSTDQVKEDSKKRNSKSEPKTHIVIELNQEQLAKFLLVQEVSNIKVVKHMGSQVNPYHAKISTVFPEQREIRQLRGETKVTDTEIVVDSVNSTPTPSEQ